MVVSETKQEKLSVIYQAFCETWLSLLFPRQRNRRYCSVQTKLCVLGSECIEATTHRKQRSGITRRYWRFVEACGNEKETDWTLYRWQ